jgi:repressor LexA
MCHLRALEKKQFIRREKNMSRAIQLVEDRRGNIGIPLAGVIAAGVPLQAVEQPGKIDFRDLFNDPNMFALKVRGESMVEDQIADGDYVVVRKQDEAVNGDIVVALIDGEEATLKRFYRETERVRLEPANSAMQPIFSQDVRILGIVVGVVRRYNS